MILYIIHVEQLHTYTIHTISAYIHTTGAQMGFKIKFACNVDGAKSTVELEHYY